MKRLLEIDLAEIAGFVLTCKSCGFAMRIVPGADSTIPEAKCPCGRALYSIDPDGAYRAWQKVNEALAVIRRNSGQWNCAVSLQVEERKI